MKPPYVIIAGSNFGFPQGGAASSRVRHLAQGMKNSGAHVRVLHLSCTEERGPRALNTRSEGIYRGVPYTYTPGTPYKSTWFIGRRFLSFKGVVLSLKRIYELKKNNQADWVYLYERDAFVTVPIISACRVMNIPVILELNEWLPALPRYSRFQSLIFKNYTLKRVGGIVAISEYLKQAVQHANVPVITVPVLKECNSTTETVTMNACMTPYILWCGDVNGYCSSAVFLIRVLAELRKKKMDATLVLSGNISKDTHENLMDVVRDLEIPVNTVECPGYVSVQRLQEYYDHASALALPLFSTDKDAARFPTKLAEYFASGRPVVASRIGEITRFARDGIHAFLARTGDEKDFANKLFQILTDPETSKRIGKNGKELCRVEFNPDRHGRRILNFAQSLVRHD